MSEWTHLDLFSGIGGFALASRWAGGRTLAFSETADYPSQVLRCRFPGIPNLGDANKLCRRIHDCEWQRSEYDEDEFLRCPRCSSEYEDIDFGDCECIGTDQFFEEVGAPDVITGGVPCQPSSRVGKRHGDSDHRWQWPNTVRIFSELRPAFGLLENPRAILTLDGGRAFRDILGAFTQIGYDVQWDAVPASVLGAGHRRDRLWILVADSACAGLEGYAGNGQGVRQAGSHRHTPPQDLLHRTITSRQWYRQSGVESVVDGLSGGMVKDEVMAVGNSLVPQLAYVFLDAIGKQLTGQ